MDSIAVTAKTRSTARLRGIAALFLLCPVLLIPASAQDAGAGLTERVDFEADILPIFEERCLACHGPSQQMGEFRLDSKAVALGGGVSGPNILPGQADESPLLQRVAGIGDLNAMPMSGERLSPRQIGLIRAWIADGAQWPDGVGTQGREVAGHWAYTRPVRPVPPPVKHERDIRNAIDSFLLARLEQAGLAFQRDASRQTLIRRLSLDLTGLPPSVAEVDHFVADRSPDAYERLVDRLLKSPHFGEHWAGYWLDLARYADTNGYESDEPRSIWAYRDWVIDAFNRNLPFDQFTAEQLAGDLLPDPSVDQLVATGFHRNTMLNNEAGSKNDEFYDAAVKDRVDTTATVWLGSTVGCAQCHDHKYDPFKQDEYYRLYSIFNNTADSAIKISEELEVFKGDRYELRRRQREVDAAEAALSTPSPELERAQRAWEGRIASSLAAWDKAWQVIHPASGPDSADPGVQAFEDGSFLATSDREVSGQTTVELEAGPGLLSGLRIEALPQERSTQGGTAQHEGGDFAVTGIDVEAWTPVLRSQQSDAEPTAPVWGNWHAIGPFRVRSRDEAFRTSFPPETNQDLAQTYEEGHLAWNERKDWIDGRVHYLSYIPDDSESNCASYAYRTVEAPHPTTVTLSIGTLKGLKVWLNDSLVLSTDPTREIAPDQEELRLDLKAGTNEILLKLTNDTGPYAFYFAPYHGAQKEARRRLAGAAADHGGWESEKLSAALDGNHKTAWRLEESTARFASRSTALLRLAEPVSLAEGSTIRLTLFHASAGKGKADLGRLRVSMTSADSESLAEMQITPRRVRDALATAAADRAEDDLSKLAAHYRLVAPELEPQRRRLADLRAQLEEFRAAHTTKTLVMRELVEPRETHVQRRGNFLDLAERVAPGVPSALDPEGRFEVGNRLELAKWLTDVANPLTARVRVNQIWNRIFGRGLVAMSEDFGTQGDPPSHPGLLDWLATEFMHLGWDTQALLRTIVTSAAYRQSSAAAPEQIAADPSNALYSRGARFRVSAETVRDIALAASGQLSRSVGGPSVFPPQPPEVMGDHFVEGGFKEWPTSEGADRVRRGLYTFYKRTVVYPAFMNFDAPDRTVCKVDRSLSNTPLQALNTLNDPAFFEAAAGLAQRMLAEAGEGTAERLVRGFRSVLARKPTEGEVDRLTSLLHRMEARFAAEPRQAASLAAMIPPTGRADISARDAAPWVMVANVLLNLDETFTRE